MDGTAAGPNTGLDDDEKYSDQSKVIGIRTKSTSPTDGFV